MTKALRKTMISTICMLVVAVLSLTGVTYAWFTAGTEATVGGLNVTVTAAEGGVQIRVKDGEQYGNYASTINLNATKTGITPVSSANGKTFFELSVNPDDSTKANTVAKTDLRTSVITYDFKLKNPGAEDITVILDPSDTKVEKPGEEEGSNDISGAVRMALIVTGATTPTGENGADADVVDYLTKYTGNTNSDDIIYIWAKNDANYIGIKGASPATVKGDDNSDVPAWLTLSNGIIPANDYAEQVTTTASDECEIILPGISADGTETEVYLTLVIWVEGQDADCVNKNAAASFDVDLKFIVKS